MDINRHELAIFLGFILFPMNLLYMTPGNADLDSDRAALLKLRSVLHGRPLLWNLSSSPCSWNGVTCYKDRVIELRLPGMGLSGSLPSNAIGNLSHLETLSLRFNSLAGPIPPDLANLISLQNLHLQGNRFSGSIPSFIFSMQNLTCLDLASNNFNGDISPSFNNLTRLRTLNLEKNQFVGSIPSLTIQLGEFNVSYNKLSGPIPVELSGMPESAFLGNSLCGKPLNNSCDAMTGGRKKLSSGAVAGILIACLFTFLIIVIILTVLCLRKVINSSSEDMQPVKDASDVQSTRGKPVRDGGTEFSASGVRNLAFFGKDKEERVFDLEDLLSAPAEVLGKGTFGTTYRAELRSGTVVAVKRLREVKVPAGVFRQKVEELGNMDHENLVPLRACYCTRDEKLLINDHIPTGSLSAILHDRGDGRTPLGWETRCRIALGTARGIAYIHSRGCNISHGNIKSSNILLTETYEARISDYGLAVFSSPRSRLYGYLPSEAVTEGPKVSQQADVYCYGVLILELLTGKAANSARWNEESALDLPRWVHSVVRQEWISEVFDPELLRYENVEEDMVQLLRVAMDCTTLDPSKRPSMAEVRNRMDSIMSHSR